MMFQLKCLQPLLDKEHVIPHVQQRYFTVRPNPGDDVDEVHRVVFDDVDHSPRLGTMARSRPEDESTTSP